jgi:Mn2+/Fe2+ NRAMP family transporter
MAHADPCGERMPLLGEEDAAVGTGGRQPGALEARDRYDVERRRVLAFSNREVFIALVAAGLINIAMVMMTASAFHAGFPDVAQIETAYHTLTPLLGGAAAAVFLLSLVASGVSSSTVGTMAGQMMIMQGFVGFRIPVWLRRLVTMVSAFVVVAIGVNATDALVVSQVLLSIALPLPMTSLLIFTRRADIMGEFAKWPSHSGRGDDRCRCRPAAQRIFDCSDLRHPDSGPADCGMI